MFSTIDIILFAIAVVAIALVALRAAGSGARGTPVPLILLGLGALAVLLILYRLIDSPAPSDLPDEVDVSRKIGIFIGLIGAAGIAYGGWRANTETPPRAAGAGGHAATGRLGGARKEVSAGAAASARLTRQPIGAKAQQVHEVAARAERIGDRGAGVDRERGPELIAHLGEEDVSGGRGGAVEDCKTADGELVGGGCAADGDVHSGFPS